MSRSRRIAAVLWLALALLFGQEAAALHGLAHAAAKVSQQEGTPAQSGCDICSLCAELGGAVAPGFAPMPGADVSLAAPDCGGAVLSPAAKHFAFQSRGPPPLP